MLKENQIMKYAGFIIDQMIISHRLYVFHFTNDDFPL